MPIPLYDEYLEKENKDKKLSLESFTYSIYELGLLYYELKINLENMVLIKKELGLDSHKEESIIKYLDYPEVNIEEE